MSCRRCGRHPGDPVHVSDVIDCGEMSVFNTHSYEPPTLDLAAEDSSAIIGRDDCDVEGGHMVRVRFIRGDKKVVVDNVAVVPHVGDTVEIQGWKAGGDEQEGYTVTAVHHLIAQGSLNATVASAEHEIHIELE
jgi:hypothetical protein